LGNNDKCWIREIGTAIGQGKSKPIVIFAGQFISEKDSSCDRAVL
jgi:hypothetical protein